MSVSTQELARLKRELERRSKTIVKSASLSKLQFRQTTDGALEVQGWWRKPGTWPSWSAESFETYTHRFESGQLFRDGPLGPQLTRRPCNITRCLIQQFLNARGI